MLRFLPFVFRQVLRRRGRTLLTVSGVAVAMFLFGTVSSMQRGLEKATQVAAQDTRLIVYRENRFCPFASRLPQSYLGRIRLIPGVVSALPMRVVVNNCRTSLDVVVFRGVPREAFLADAEGRFQLLAGSLADWHRRSDAAVVGASLAARRGLKPGDTFEAAGVAVQVVAVVDSSEAQDKNVAFVDLAYLQNAVDRKRGRNSAAGGIVTQFNVEVERPGLLESVSKQIDALFHSDQEPTSTSPEKAFVAKAAAEIVELVGFTRLLGVGCLLAVLALVANAVILGVQDRIRENAVLATIGFTPAVIAFLIVAEGLVLSLLGGGLGVAGVALLLGLGDLSLSKEGLSIVFELDPQGLLLGLAAAFGLGLAAGLVPALQAARREIAASFRS